MWRIMSGNSSSTAKLARSVLASGRAYPAAIELVEQGSAVSRDGFERRFEIPSAPCVMRGLASDWPASHGAWSVETLLSRFPDHEWDQGLESGVTTTLASFLAEYKAALAFSQPDNKAGDGVIRLEASRYIFDDVFGEALPELLRDYAIPHMFPAYEEDYLSYLSTVPALRPRYRWLLVGLPGSGFTIHQDPYATSAWNTMVEGGCKRWVMLPPSTPLGLVLPSLQARSEAESKAEAAAADGNSAAVDGKNRDSASALCERVVEVNPNQPQEPPPYWTSPDSEEGNNSDCGVELPETEASAAAWFQHVLPTLRHRAASEYGIASQEQLGLLEFDQRPGDTVFIPAGWWHVALTLSGQYYDGDENNAPGSHSKPSDTITNLSSTVAGLTPQQVRDITVAVTYNYLPASGFDPAIRRLTERPGGTKSAYKWCKRAADAGLTEAARCLQLPEVAAAAAEIEAEAAEG